MGGEVDSVSQEQHPEQHQNHRTIEVEPPFAVARIFRLAERSHAAVQADDARAVRSYWAEGTGWGSPLGACDGCIGWGWHPHVGQNVGFGVVSHFW